MTETARRYMGNSVPRKEDAALLAGRATFTDDIRLPGMLHLAILRSPYAHARITSIDTSAAKAIPGVVGVYSGEDLADEWAIGIPCGWPVTEDIKMPDHWPLARSEVNHVGEGVAVVVAEDRYKAQDALEHIEVDYEPLAAVVDVEAALEDGSPLAHEEFGTNECYTWPLATGDIDEAFEKADVVVKGRYLQRRVFPSAIEPRAVVATSEPASGGFVVYTSTQVPHFVKDILSAMCGLPDTKLRVVAPDVGGAFGSKLNVYAEEALALALTRTLSVPVR
jgi:aerobic carbon-monoxide dehydrogenase large subunit